MGNSNNTNSFMQSIIPFAMMAGCGIGAIVGLFLNPSYPVYAISIGTGIGFFIGILVSVFYKVKDSE